MIGLFAINSWIIFRHPTSNSDVIRNGKDPHSLRCWLIEISIHPISDEIWVDQEILQKYKLLLKLIGKPYAVVALEMLSSTVINTNLREKVHKYWQ